MSKATQTRKNLEEFANIFLQNHSDKMREINLREVVPRINTVLEWTDEDTGCKWYLRKCFIPNEQHPITEYVLRREYPKLTKSINEKTINDECWIYIPSELARKPLNDSKNAVIEGLYFQGYSGYRPRGYSAAR